MKNLGTNTLVQEPAFKPDYLQAAKSKQERFYVIYKWPRAGIYTNWGKVHKICQEDRSTNKKFSNIEQAQMEFHIHGEHGERTKTNPVLLRPKINPKIDRRWEEHRDHRIKISEEPIGLEPIVYHQEFVQLWNKARAACQEDFIHERFYTTDKPSKSLYNFVEGADSRLVYQAFRQMRPKDQKSSHKNSTEEDINLLNQFGLPFLKNTIEAKGTTKEAYCRQARQLFEKHSCIYCTESKDKEAGPSTSPIMAVPTTEDESSSD
ncbi:hypothetical protein Tco_0703024 [Tanacetum coccineum]|uniref:Uncharacterized protein n=1 Tax=Tanacetum coccineum TaxID=301880 RepID=A0ABQ4XXP5_9ASTR